MGSDILETEQMFDYGEVTIMSIINILFWAFLVLAALLIYGLLHSTGRPSDKPLSN